MTLKVFFFKVESLSRFFSFVCSAKSVNDYLLSLVAADSKIDEQTVSSVVGWSILVVLTVSGTKRASAASRLQHMLAEKSHTNRQGKEPQGPAHHTYPFLTVKCGHQTRTSLLKTGRVPFSFHLSAFIQVSTCDPSKASCFPEVLLKFVAYKKQETRISVLNWIRHLNATLPSQV